MRPIRRPVGLTLVEVLVALALWGLMTALMTQGLDVLLRSQQQQTQRDQAQSRLQASLSQWKSDLDQLDTSLNRFTPMDWNGRVLRWVRHSAAPAQGLRTVVAWTLKDGRWVRWQSEPVARLSELQLAWQTALVALEQTPGVADDGVAAQSWQVFFYRNDAWSNALSSADPAQATPDAIRLQLELSAAGPWRGLIQWDWLRPTWSVNRS